MQAAQQALAVQQQVAADAQSKLDAAAAAATAADAAVDQAKAEHANALAALADAQAKLSAAKDERNAADKALDQAIAELNAEIARQEAAERGNGEQTQPATQVTYQAKHMTSASGVTTPQTTMPATGDASDLLGETLVIGGTVLVAAGVFLSDKRRQLIR